MKYKANKNIILKSNKVYGFLTKCPGKERWRDNGGKKRNKADKRETMASEDHSINSMDTIEQ